MKETVNKRKVAIVCKVYNIGKVFIEESFKDYDAAVSYAEILNAASTQKESSFTYKVFVQDPDDYSDFTGYAMVCYLGFGDTKVLCKQAFHSTDEYNAIRYARGASCALCDASDSIGEECFVMVEDGTKVDDTPHFKSNEDYAAACDSSL